MLTPYDEELIVGSDFTDRYQIVSVVGRGAMGIVYQARHKLMGRIVAIKTLRGLLQQDERSVKRFEREARAASRMDHPNLIAVHDFGLTEHRQPYLVMEYVKGSTLQEILKREGRINPERLVHMFIQVCDALHHAHTHGVIHRDMKPANIMLIEKVNEPDYVKVFDLGIAKIAWGEAQDHEALTGTGEVCGSPIYLSPEQCTHDKLDARSDIYAIGVVMYELLTGVPPIMGETVYDTIYMHVHSAPIAMKDAAPDAWIPPRLERIIMKALAKNPDDRYENMQELKTALQLSLQKSDPGLQVLPPEALNALRKPTPSSTFNTQPANPNVSQTQIAPTEQRQDSAPTERRKASAPPTELRMPPRPQSQITRWLQGTPLEPLSRVSPTKAAVISAGTSIVLTAAAMTVLNINSKRESAEKTISAGSRQYHEMTEQQRTAAATAAKKHFLQSGMGSDSDSYSGTSPIKRGPRTASAAAKSSAKNGKQNNQSATPSKLNSPSAAAMASKVGSEKAEHGQARAANKAPGKTAVAAKSNKYDDNALGFFSIFSSGPQAAKQNLSATRKMPGPSPSPDDDNAVSHGRNDSVDGADSNSRIASSSTGNGGRSDVTDPQSSKSTEVSNDAKMLNNEGARLIASDPEQAIQKFSAALRLSHGYTVAKRNLGRAYFNQGNRLFNDGNKPAAERSYGEAYKYLKQTLGESAQETQQALEVFNSLKAER